MSIGAARDHLPVWGEFVIIVILVMLAIEAGYRVGRARRRRFPDEAGDSTGAVVAASLALLGFILAFTFGLAASRFDARRQMVVEEANAIGTTYLRAGLLPDRRGEAIRRLLVEYVDVRLEVPRTGDVELALRRSVELHDALWREAEAAGLARPDSIGVGLFITALNETIDTHSKRVLIGVRSRLPGALWAALYLVTFVSMAGVGYQAAFANSRRTLVTFLLVLNFSAITALVSDLDRPKDGFLRVDQQAMTELRRTMAGASGNEAGDRHGNGAP